MNPLQILANVGLTLADFNLTTVALRLLQEKGYSAKSWTAFQGLAKSLGIGTGPAGAVKAYQIGRVLAHPEMWVPAIGDVGSIPRQMMKLSLPSDEARDAGESYRYDVGVTVHFLGSGDKVVWGVHVDSPTTLPESEVIRRAEAAARGQLIGRSPKLLTDEGPDFDFGDVTINAVFRYV